MLSQNALNAEKKEEKSEHRSEVGISGKQNDMNKKLSEFQNLLPEFALSIEFFRQISAFSLHIGQSAPDSNEKTRRQPPVEDHSTVTDFARFLGLSAL